MANWYLENSNMNITLEQLYEKWINWKKTPSNQDSIRRIQFLWAAYYKKEPLSQKLIQKQVAGITSFDLREWAESLLKKHYPVDKKKFGGMFTIINQCLEYAADEDIGIIPENVWRRAREKAE